VYRQRADGLFVQSNSRLIPAAFFAGTVLLDAPGLWKDVGRPGLLAFNAIIVGACAVLLVRSWRSATLILNDRQVVVRSLLRTRRWPRTAVAGFEVATRIIGPGRWQRRVLGIAFVDGTTRWLSEINCRPGGPEATTWVDQTATALNDLSGGSERSK
jgi:hypothetical protein